MDGAVVRVPAGLLQPIAADDVAIFVSEVALTSPRNAIIEIAGPGRAPFDEFVARYLKAVGDPREVVNDSNARYFGGHLEEKSLVPLEGARLGRLNLENWLRPRANCLIKPPALSGGAAERRRLLLKGESPLARSGTLARRRDRKSCRSFPMMRR